MIRQGTGSGYQNELSEQDSQWLLQNIPNVHLVLSFVFTTLDASLTTDQRVTIAATITTTARLRTRSTRDA